MEESQLVQAFEFDGHRVRVQMFDGEPWWVASNVLVALGHNDNVDVLSALAEVPYEWKGNKPFALLFGVDELPALSEHGLYVLLARSIMPAAIPFHKWIASEVLPQIRKTGRYSDSKTPVESLLDAVQNLVDHERRMRELEAEHFRVRSAQQVIAKRVGDLARRAAEGAAMILAPPEQAEELAVEPVKEPVVDPPVLGVCEVPLRERINQIVQRYIDARGLSNEEAGMVWSKLYSEFRTRHGIDLVRRAKNRGHKVSGLDIVEELDRVKYPGSFSDLYIVSRDLYGFRADSK
jgi:prophage antirepressor-like protein